MDDAAVSRSKNGKVKLEYVQDGKKRTALWEPMCNGVVETIFDDSGAVLRQVLLPEKAGEGADCHMQRLISELKVMKTAEKEFSEVKINKKCPTCDSDSLVRFTEGITDTTKAPVMPTYICKSCNGKSYYLTDDYLEYLVSNNKEMFEPKELAEMEKDRGAFIHELREYIIRIFASKKIARIK